MRVAGIRLPDDRVMWLDAGEHELAPLDRVRARAAGEDVAGIVFVAPEQVLQPPVEVAGTITDVAPRPRPDPGCDDLPGADLPPLGTRFEAGGVVGMVVRLDPVGRTVTVRPDEGELEDRQIAL